MIPRFKVIRLGWRRSAVAQAATIARARPKISAMNFHAPHDPARERETITEAVLATFPPHWRAQIFIAGPAVELRCPISEEAALAIGNAFQRAFPDHEVSLNGVPLAEAPGYPWMPWTTPVGPRCVCCGWLRCGMVGGPFRAS